MTDIVESRREYMRQYLHDRYHTKVKLDPVLLEEKRRSNRETQRKRRMQPEVRQRDRDTARRARQKDVLKFLVKAARWRALAKGLAFDLTDEWARERWTGHCEVTGIAFEPRVGGQGTRSPSLD